MHAARGFDSDGDGLDDEDEFSTGWTVSRDVDGDGETTGPGETIPEVFSVPWLADEDSDLLWDLGERLRGTIPNDEDSDGDLLLDGEESYSYLRLYDVHQRPSLVFFQGFRFGYAGKTIDIIEARTRAADRATWIAYLVPDSFTSSDFSDPRDWTLSAKDICPGCGFFDVFSFFMVRSTGEVPYAYLAIEEYVVVGESGAHRDIHFGVYMPINALASDTDLDRVPDGTELLQLNARLAGNPAVDLDLDNSGGTDANPVEPDIFVEVDWMADHAPRTDLESRMARLFREQGMGFHMDRNEVVPTLEVFQGADWNAYYTTYFTANRHSVFRYGVYVKHLPEVMIEGKMQEPCGLGSPPGDMHVVRCGDHVDVFAQELGHNFLGEIDDSTIWLSPTDHYHTNIPCDFMSAHYLDCSFLNREGTNFSPSIWREMATQRRRLGLGLSGF